MRTHKWIHKKKNEAKYVHSYHATQLLKRRSGETMLFLVFFFYQIHEHTNTRASFRFRAARRLQQKSPGGGEWWVQLADESRFWEYTWDGFNGSRRGWDWGWFARRNGFFLKRKLWQILTLVEMLFDSTDESISNNLISSPCNPTDGHVRTIAVRRNYA